MVDKVPNNRRVCCEKSQVNHRDTKTQRKPELELGENKRMDKNITLKKDFSVPLCLWLKMKTVLLNRTPESLNGAIVSCSRRP